MSSLFHMRPEAPGKPLTQDVKIAEKRNRFFSSSTAKNAFEKVSAKQVRAPLKPLHLRVPSCNRDSYCLYFDFW